MKEHERGFRMAPPYSFQDFADSVVFGTALHQLLWDTSEDSIPKDDNTYVFRGSPNMFQLVYDCIESGKLGFIAIAPDHTFVGIRTRLGDYKPSADYLNLGSYIATIEGYMLYKVVKRHTSDVMAFLQETTANRRKEIKKMARKIRKQRGKFSHLPETKVITY